MMFKLARALERLVSILLDKKIITKEEFEYILDPLYDVMEDDE